MFYNEIEVYAKLKKEATQEMSNTSWDLSTIKKDSLLKKAIMYLKMKKGSKSLSPQLDDCVCTC